MSDQPTTIHTRPARPDHLHVAADTTPGAHRTDTEEIVWWLPVLGPTATVLPFTLARYTPRTGATWDTYSLARRIGLAGNRSKLWASFDRLDHFGVAQFHATDVLTIRLWLPALNESQLARLPDELASEYQRPAPTSIPA